MPIVNSVFEEYKKYLEFDFSSDYWPDEGISIATLILIRFVPADWDRLSETWKGESKEWKVRCAETMDYGVTGAGFPILLAMLLDAESDVVVAAIDSLRSWPKGSPEFSDMVIDK